MAPSAPLRPLCAQCHLGQGVRASKLDALVRYFKAALDFVADVHAMVAQAMELLTSRVKSDIVEAVGLLTVASECGVEAAEAGVRQMVHLIWTKDENAAPVAPVAPATGAAGAPAIPEEAAAQEPARSPREHLMHAYKTLFLTADPALPAKDQAQQIARNLFAYATTFAAAHASPPPPRRLG